MHACPYYSCNFVCQSYLCKHLPIFILIRKTRSSEILTYRRRSQSKACDHKSRPSESISFKISPEPSFPKVTFSLSRTCSKYVFLFGHAPSLRTTRESAYSDTTTGYILCKHPWPSDKLPWQSLSHQYHTSINQGTPHQIDTPSPSLDFVPSHLDFEYRSVVKQSHRHISFDTIRLLKPI